MVETNTSLNVLRLSGQKCGKQGVISLANAIKINKNLNLQELDLSYNGEIEADAGIAIAEALTVNKTLKKLNLRKSQVYSKGAVHIAKSLYVNQTLTYLNLCCCDIRLEGTIAICDAMVNSTTLNARLQPEGEEDKECRDYLNARLGTCY